MPGPRLKFLSVTVFVLKSPPPNIYSCASATSYTGFNFFFWGGGQEDIPPSVVLVGTAPLDIKI